MIELDTLWRNPRYASINGTKVRVPFAVDLDSGLVDPIRRWIDQSGLQFAAKRVKALKTWAIQVLSGCKNYKEPWFSHTHYRGYQVPRLKLFNILIDHQHDLIIIRKVLTVLSSYRMTMVGEPSLESISQVEPSPDADHYIPLLRYYVSLPEVPKFVLEPAESVGTRTKASDDFGRTFEGPIGQMENDYLLSLGVSIAPKCLGRIVPIPDKGKWRNILVGHHLLQLKTKKLADWLRQWLWNQPEVSSGDQSKMSTFIIDSLQKGRYMLSIDLSEATDRLSRDLQIKLLQSMGVPRDYLTFLQLPCYYRDKDFGGSTEELKKIHYSNGQPMGLYLSFPMFELAHYVLLRWVTRPYKAEFTICGDDCVISCDEKDADAIYGRYSSIITRFGGKISLSKTLRSRRVAEGVGALFIRGIPKEIRIPNGKISDVEALCPGTWLNQQVRAMSSIGRAIFASWLSSQLDKEYTYDQRRQANELLVNLDLSTWSNEALQSLIRPDRMPRSYSRFDDDLYQFWRNTPGTDEKQSFHWIGLERYRDVLVSNKIITFYKEENRGNTDRK